MSSNALDFGDLGFRNFLSYGPKEVIIPLLGNFITDGGEDSRNGVGKSAIIDALCYVLFGKVIRGISNQKLINKMSDKGQMIVWVEFEKGDFAYHVERTERPGRLLLLRKPIDSDEDFKTKVKRKMKFDIARGKTETTDQIIDILGFDITLFEYIVANSSESTEFFKLSEDKQRAVIEPLFGFTIMSTKAKALKEDRKERNKELAHAESSAEATKQANLRITQQIDDLKHRSVAWEGRKDATVTELTEAISLLESVDVDQEIAILREIEELDSTMREVTSRLRELDAEQRERTNTMNAHGRDAERAVADIEKAEETIAALDHSECPTCKQHWEPDPEFREEALASKKAAEDAGAGALASFEEMVTDIEVHVKKLDGIRKPLPIIEERLADLNQIELTYRTVEEAASAGTELDNIRKQLVSTSAETNPHSESIEGLQTDAIKVVDESEIHELRRLIRHYTYLIELLTKRDSFLRQIIIDRWMPILNQRIAYWLDILQLPHHVHFNPDLTVTITNYSEEFDYGNLSKGQRLRVRVALNFSFQDVFEYMNYPINMLAVDELLDSGMCSSGAANAVNALREICRKKEKRVFLITHRDDIAARVDDVMNVVLENNQSRIEYEQVIPHNQS